MTSDNLRKRTVQTNTEEDEESMFPTEQNCPDCEIREVEPDNRDVDVVIKIEHCDLHKFTTTGGEAER